MVSVLDVASRRVLGFALGERHDAHLAYGALAMAIMVRGGQVPGVVFHTDQGSEYTARSSNSRVECHDSMTALSSADPGRPIDWETESR